MSLPLLPLLLNGLEQRAKGFGPRHLRELALSGPRSRSVCLILILIFRHVQCSCGAQGIPIRTNPCPVCRQSRCFYCAVQKFRTKGYAPPAGCPADSLGCAIEFHRESTTISDDEDDCNRPENEDEEEDIKQGQK